MFKAQRIRDPLHNLIEFGANEFEHALWSVIQTPQFQRLRRIKQLGFSDLVYPGATHSRFAHSVGAFHIARRLMRIIRERLGEQKFLETRAHQALAAALVHDLGHGPFSHAFEDVGKRLDLIMADHEKLSDAMIRDSDVADKLQVLGSGFANDVAEIVAGGPQNIYAAVVSSQFDADRLDYMQRDRMMSGSEHAAIDFEWLLANVQVGEVARGVDQEELGVLETFVIGPKAVCAAEAYVLGLFQLYPTVYFHKATRAAEKMFTELLVKAIQLIQDGSVALTGLKATHPLAQFAKDPGDIQGVTALDDTAVTGALSVMAEAKDPQIKELAERLRDRKLYKSINVREEMRRRLELGSSPGDEEIISAACASIEVKVDAYLAKKGADDTSILVDEAERAPYKHFQDSKGPLNRIMVQPETGPLVDLGRRSKVVSAIETFRLFRLYVREEDEESHTFIEKCMEEERGARNATQTKTRSKRRSGNRPRRRG